MRGRFEVGGVFDFTNNSINLNVLLYNSPSSPSLKSEWKIDNKISPLNPPNFYYLDKYHEWNSLIFQQKIIHLENPQMLELKVGVLLLVKYWWIVWMIRVLKLQRWWVDLMTVSHTLTQINIPDETSYLNFEPWTLDSGCSLFVKYSLHGKHQPSKH